MRCETVVGDFQNVLLEKIEAVELSKDLSIHLQNCNYCQKDCQKLIADYVSQPNINKNTLQPAFLLFKSTETNISYKFTLLNYDPFLIKLLKEIERAILDFIDNPVGFIKEIIDSIFDKQDSPYWDKSVRLATLIWLSSCVSIVLYGGFGWWWFSSNNIEPKNNNLLVDNEKIYYISASLPYPPTYWSRDTKISSNKTLATSNNTLAAKTSSKSKGRSAESVRSKANLSTKINSSIGSTKTPTPEIRGYSFFVGEPKVISTDANNIGIAKETTGNFVTGGKFVSSPSVQISTTDTKEDEVECCDYGNIPMCAEHKAMIERNSVTLQFGTSSSSNRVGAISPSANSGSQIRAFVTPNTVSGGGMFSTNTKSNTNNSTTEESMSVKVEARSLPPIIKVGESGFLSIVVFKPGVNPIALITNFTATIQFNSSVIKITSVSDGGLMSSYGVKADFNYNISKNSVKINISRPANAKAVESFGQLALLRFEAIAPGFADFTLTDVQLLGTNGERLPITLVNNQTEVLENK